MHLKWIVKQSSLMMYLAYLIRRNVFFRKDLSKKLTKFLFCLRILSLLIRVVLTSLLGLVESIFISNLGNSNLSIKNISGQSQRQTSILSLLIRVVLTSLL